MSPPEIADMSNKTVSETVTNTANGLSGVVMTDCVTKTSVNIGIADDLPKIEKTDAIVNSTGAATANDISESDKTEQVTSSFAALTTEIHHIKASTLVFFDVETTGLASCVGKKNVQITEISMIAVGRDEFCKCTYPDLRDIRIVNKLSLCTKPRCPVSRDAENITGLSNNNLQNQGPFDANTAVIILGFLSHLQKPVCILAHNGKVFDFPVLKAEFEKLKLQLPSDFYIVDTLAGFRKIDVPDLPFSQKLHKDVKFKKNGDISYALQNLHLYFFGKPYLGSHSSEGDCIALAKVCHKVRDKIIPWIEDNCLTFDSVQPMW